MKGLVSRYALWRASTLGCITERLETRIIFDLAGNLAGKRVLDVGTGDGTYALEAARRGARVTGLDLDAKMLKAAAGCAFEGRLQVDFRQGRLEALPFADCSFEVVLAVTVFCLIFDTKTAVREIARVLVPGGRLVLGELGRFSTWAAKRRLQGWYGSDTWRHARFWSGGDLARLTQAAGLQISEVRSGIYFPPFGLAAKVIAPLDNLLGRMHAPGAAFIALAASKPGAGGPA